MPWSVSSTTGVPEFVIEILVPAEESRIHIPQDRISEISRNSR